MIRPADQNLPEACLLLEVALQAKVGVPFGQHLLVHRSVRRMAGGASLANRLMREDKGSFLVSVALETGFFG